MNARRKREILDAYVGHARRFEKIASRRPAARWADLGHEAVEKPPVQDERLSERQLEVLGLVAAGLSNQEICTRLDVTVETVKTHLIHILQRLSARNRAHAVAISYKHGLLA